MTTPPTNVTAKWTATAGQMEVDWTPASGSSGYAVNGSIDGGASWHQIGHWVEGGGATQALIPGLDESKEWLVRVRSLSGSSPSAVVKVPAVVKPPPPPPAGVVWAADGERGGPTNDPLKEWCTGTGPGWDNNAAHPAIELVAAMDAVHGGHAPRHKKYLYRFNLTWWKGDTAISRYGDRLELINALRGVTQPPGLQVNPAGFPAGAAEWHEGDESWIAYPFYVPLFNEVVGGKPGQYETGWSEDSSGQFPVAQFHPKGSPSPPFGLRIRGMRGSLGAHTPHMTCEASGSDVWQEQGSYLLGHWYDFLLNVRFSATTGFVKVWCDRNDGAGMVYRGERVNFKTYDASWGYITPCMGSHRNENTMPSGVESNLLPPDQLWYTEGMTFAKDRASATASAFGVAV